MDLSDAEFEQLLALRTGLRRFLHWSEEQARAAGLTPAQHQLLLAVRGHRGPPEGPTIGELARHLILRHHSTSELVDRAEAARLVRRSVDPANASVVRVGLTALGRAKLSELSASHMAELSQLGPTMRTLWRAIEEAGRARGKDDATGD